MEKVKSSRQEGLIIEKERLTSLKRAKETAALNIRRKNGINFARFQKDTGFDLLKIEGKALEVLKSQRLIAFKKINSTVYGVRLTRTGFLFCDHVCREFL